MTFVGLAVHASGFCHRVCQPRRHRQHDGADGHGGRGIVVSLIGIMGVITPAYQKTWIYKKS